MSHHANWTLSQVAQSTRWQLCLEDNFLTELRWVITVCSISPRTPEEQVLSFRDLGNLAPLCLRLIIVSLQVFYCEWVLTPPVLRLGRHHVVAWLHVENHKPALLTASHSVQIQVNLGTYRHRLQYLRRKNTIETFAELLGSEFLTQG